MAGVYYPQHQAKFSEQNVNQTFSFHGNMTRIAVFDSGLGSLSVIKPIQKRIKAEIIYFADQKNYPYGTKTVSQLDKIIKSTISKLQEKFNPDIIIVGSNTPSLLLDIEKKDKIIGSISTIKGSCIKNKVWKNWSTW